MTFIIELQYFASSIFYSTLSVSKHCIFDQYERYQKMSFRNRCTLSGANGPVHLSVPLIGGRNQRTVMKEVRILNSEKWQANHWKTIMSVFNKSPFFEHYRDDLEPLFQKRFEFLVDWNLACFEWMADKLAIDTSWSLTEKYVGPEDLGETEDWRGKLMPSIIGAMETNIRYFQVFEERTGFVPNLSVLDYLFCNGSDLEGFTKRR